MTDPPERLVAAARSGSKQAHEAIYGQLHHFVRRIALRICMDEATAEDVVQEVFLRAFGSIASFRGDAPLWSWLRTITVRVALDHRSCGPDPVAWDSVHLAAGSPDPSIAHDVEKILAGLPQEVRAIVWMNRIEGMTHREIAQVTGKSESHSKSLVARALQQIALKYRQLDHDES